MRKLATTHMMIGILITLKLYWSSYRSSQHAASEFKISWFYDYSSVYWYRCPLLAPKCRKKCRQKAQAIRWPRKSAIFAVFQNSKARKHSIQVAQEEKALHWAAKNDLTSGRREKLSSMITKKPRLVFYIFLNHSHKTRHLVTYCPISTSSSGLQSEFSWMEIFQWSEFFSFFCTINTKYSFHGPAQGIFQSHILQNCHEFRSKWSQDSRWDTFLFHLRNRKQGWKRRFGRWKISSDCNEWNL